MYIEFKAGANIPCLLGDKKFVPLCRPTAIRAWNFDNVWSFLRRQSLFE